MNAQAWHEVTSLFAQAMERPEDERLPWLEACQVSDEAVFAEVCRLIQHADRSQAR